MTQPSECEDDDVDDATGGGAAEACSLASASARSRIFAPITPSRSLKILLFATAPIFVHVEIKHWLAVLDLDSSWTRARVFGHGFAVLLVQAGARAGSILRQGCGRPRAAAALFPNLTQGTRYRDSRGRRRPRRSGGLERGECLLRADLKNTGKHVCATKLRVKVGDKQCEFPYLYVCGRVKTSPTRLYRPRGKFWRDAEFTKQQVTSPSALSSRTARRRQHPEQKRAIAR